MKVTDGVRGYGAAGCTLEGAGKIRLHYQVSKNAGWHNGLGGRVVCCACNETARQDKGPHGNWWALNTGRVLISAGIQVAGVRGGPKL